MQVYTAVLYRPNYMRPRDEYEYTDSSVRTFTSHDLQLFKDQVILEMVNGYAYTNYKKGCAHDPDLLVMVDGVPALHGVHHDIDEVDFDVDFDDIHFASLSSLANEIGKDIRYQATAVYAKQKEELEEKKRQIERDKINQREEDNRKRELAELARLQDKYKDDKIG